MKTVFSKLKGVSPLPDAGYFRCPESRGNLSVFRRNKIPPVRVKFLDGVISLVIHQINVLINTSGITWQLFTLPRGDFFKTTRRCKEPRF